MLTPNLKADTKTGSGSRPRTALRFLAFAVALLTVAALQLGAVAARADGFDDADRTLDQELLADGRLDITVAYGFQQKHPSVLIPIISPLETLVSSFDFDAESTLKSVNDLDRALMARGVGFKKTTRLGENIYETTVKRGEHEVTVHVNVIFPTGRDSAPRLKGQFLAALKASDVIIYDGHSRNGGGFPDFDRPVFGDGKVFEESGGRWPALEQHPFARYKKQVFAVISCESDQYYHRVLRGKLGEKDAASLALILTKHPGYEEDLAPTNAALIGGLMAGDRPETILDHMEQAATHYYGGEFDPTAPPLFSQDGFITSRIPAPGWHVPAVERDARDAKVVAPPSASAAASGGAPPDSGVAPAIKAQ